MSDRFSQNDLVQVTREVEVTPGVIVGAGRTRVYGVAPTLTPGGSDNTSGINTGSGGIQSIRPGLRYADAEVGSELVFRLNDLELEDLVRDTFPGSEITISDSFGFDQAGTHQDGSTGPVITAAAGTFDALRATSDYVGLMLEISGAAINAANKWPKVIKAIAVDGSQIDINPLYAAAGAGLFREALVTETGKAGVIRVGAWVRNRSITNIRTINLEFSYTDQVGGSFQVAKGLTASDGKLDINGKGNVKLQVMYKGMDFTAPATTSVGSGTTDNAYVSNAVMTSGEDLAYFAIGGTTLLSGENLTAFSADIKGNAQGIDDVAGNRNRAGNTVGDIDVTGSLKVYHKHTIAAVLDAFGRSGSLTPIDMKFIDPAGNMIWVIIPAAMLAPNAAKPGAKGSKTDNSINYKTQLGQHGERTIIWQRFAAA